ncbi:MAG: tRNA uracil 4-sulfurtransferase ThiI [Bacilli bacterium]|nr:tRNA uracil 4-sulfurtransferase ThiI [Bacilli bacterium]MDY6430926.1 tRNA uracil 4-sulfurtransferase ThiI [Bacilli bacterium]
MKYDFLMIHYGELSTKGDNRKEFIRLLTRNVKNALNKFSVEVTSNRDHLYIYLKEENYEDVLSIVQEISGIQRISLVAKVEKDVDKIIQAAVELFEEENVSFKVDVKRSDKTFEMNSRDLTLKLGGALLKSNKGLKVDVHSPDVLLKVSILKDAAYISCKDFPGLGGYPLGMMGKVLLLFSGGIDSPVAAYSLMRRGIKVEAIHFASPPYTQMAVIDKLIDLAKELNVYQNDIRINVIKFTKLQEVIYDNVPEPYCITIMRRMMVRIASIVASQRNCLALATGESIGQVASQTLESINVINEVTNTPILRPICTEDKVNIIKLAKKINTFDISIRPFEDCCTIFKPKKPKTKPKLKDCLYYESQFDYQSLIDEAVASLEPIFIKNGEEVDPSNK